MHSRHQILCYKILNPSYSTYQLGIELVSLMLKTIKLVLVCLPQELVPPKSMKYWAENGINVVGDEFLFLNIAVEDFFVRQFVNSKIIKQFLESYNITLDILYYTTYKLIRTSIIFLSSFLAVS